MNTHIEPLLARVFIALSTRSFSDLKREDGQTLAEYALILTLIAAVVVGVVVIFSGTVKGLFSSASSAI